VLIIDDEVHIRRLVTRMLRLAGYDTLEAANGLQGVQLVAEHQPDIVTCDIAMPVMDGYDFLLEIRQNPTQYSGDNFARAGIILGWIGIALSIIFLTLICLGLLFFIPVTSQTGIWQ